MQHVRSVSVGIWVRHGSRRETPAENSTAHFLEHMVFKGRSAVPPEDIAVKWIPSAACSMPSPQGTDLLQ